MNSHNSVPTISVVTAVRNRAKTVADSLSSVARQDAEGVEHVVMDAMSDDGTSEIVRSSDANVRHIREPDEGLYDALNRGISMSSGEIIGFLHADDVLDNASVLKNIRNQFLTTKADIIYGDLAYVAENDVTSVKRFWQAGEFSRQKFRYGWMPPHPTVYVRREVYDEFGTYRTDFGTAADYECLLRIMYKTRLHVSYMQQLLVRMRLGGLSNASLLNRVKANRSDRLAWLANDLSPPWTLRLLKPMRKLSQFWTQKYRIKR